MTKDKDHKINRIEAIAIQGTTTRYSTYLFATPLPAPEGRW